MKKIAKQILFGFVALAMLLSLVACGGDGDTTTTTTNAGDVVTTTTVSNDAGTTTTTSDVGKQTSNQSSGKATTATKAPAGNTNLTWEQVKSKMPANLKGTTVTFFNWNELKSITDAEKAVAKFTKETGITLKWEVGNYQTYVTELAAKRAANNAPDIVRMKDCNVAMLTQLQPLSNTGYDFSDKAWDQSTMSIYNYKGKAYATSLENTLMQQQDVLMYNLDLIEKYDLEDPYTLWKAGKWTWSKFVEILTTFKDEAGDGYEAYSPNNFNNGPNMLGSDYVKYTQNGYVNNMDDPKLLKGLQMFIKLREDGLLTSLYSRVPFEAGNVLFFHEGIMSARKTHFYLVPLKSTGSLGVVPLPKIDGQDTYYQLHRELEAYAIPIGAKNAAAVPYFLRYFLDAENYDKNNFFATRNILDVYNYCKTQKNRILTYNYNTVFHSGTEVHNMAYQIFAHATEAQVSTYLGQNRGLAEAAVRQANGVLAKMQ